MKNRFGFVSNSSSSSFIVSVPKGADENFHVNITKSLLHYADKLSTLKECEEYLMEEFQYYKDVNTIEDAIEKDELVGVRYEMMKKEIKAGRVIYMGGFGTGDDTISEFLYENGGIRGQHIVHNFKILESEGE
jgi:hypothetical protein